MISAPSHQLLSNGSKVFVIFLFALMLLACGGTDKITSRSSSNKNTRKSSFPPKKKERVAKVDTVQWTEIKTDTKSMNSDLSSNYGNSNRKDHYNIVMLIPLESAEYNNSGKGNERMINYYAGAKMALDILDSEGANLTMTTIDIGNGGTISTKLREAQSAGADVIIGPYKKDDLKKAAEFAKKEEITLVSPWISSSKTTNDNPYFVQLKPSLLDHYQKMVEHVSQNYEVGEVVLLGQEGNKTDKNRAKYIQKLARSYYMSKERTPIAEYFIPLDSLKESRMLFYDYLALEKGEDPKTKVFLIPNMNSKDESFIYGAIRRLTAERGQNNVIVYGMPIVLDSEKLTFDNYNGTSAHVVTSSFVDKKDKTVAQFKSKYYDTYGALPTKEAYEGYDMMLYIGRAMVKHGSGFQFNMNQDSKGLLQSTIALFPKYQSEDENIVTGNKIDYFANKNVDVIYFKDNRFQRK